MRYFVGDERVASVSENGLITAHENGRTTISIVHLRNQVEPSGGVRSRVIGQTDLVLVVEAAQLTDDDAATDRTCRKAGCKSSAPLVARKPWYSNRQARGGGRQGQGCKVS